MTTSAKISVIICTKDRPQDVIRCIESILTQTLLPEEILVVDGSHITALELELKRHFDKKAKVTYIHTRPGLTYQRNVGIEASHQDIIVFLDDDVILDKDYLKEIMAVFESDIEGKVGGVTGEIIGTKANNFVRRILSFGFQIFATVFLLSRYGDGKFQPSGFPTVFRSGTVDKITKVEYLVGANMSFRRKIFDEFRFDEKSPYWDDDDIAYRVSRKYQNIYTPFAKLVHTVSPLGGQERGNLRLKRDVEGYYHHFKKNLPQSFNYKLAFHWSLIGLFVTGLIKAMIERNSSGLRGLAAGMKEVLEKQS